MRVMNKKIKGNGKIYEYRTSQENIYLNLNKVEDLEIYNFISQNYESMLDCLRSLVEAEIRKHKGSDNE